MPAKKELKVYFDEQGKLYEIQILIFFLGIGLAFFIPTMKEVGFWKALLKTAGMLGVVFAGIIVLLLLIEGISWLKARLSRPRKKKADVLSADAKREKP